MTARVRQDGWMRAHRRECQDPGALCRKLGGALAKPEASVEHRGPDLEHAVGAQG